MELVNANTVLLGGFNPHIIQPSWLVEQEVAADNTEETGVSVQINIGGGAQPIRFNLGGFEWEVGLTRLKISSDEGCDPSHIIKKLLELLPHTPIRAVGHNFQFRDAERKWEQPLASLPNEHLFHDKLGEQVSSAIVSTTKRNGDVDLKIVITVSSHEALIDANYHRGVDGHSGALNAIDSFGADLEHITDIAEGMCGRETRHA